MTTTVLVFMCISMVISVYSTLVITHEIISQRVKKRENNISEKQAKEQFVPVVKEDDIEVLPEPIFEETAFATQYEGVQFSSNKQTLEEKYLALSAESKGYYDEIVKYAMQIEGSRRYKNARHEEYKIGNARIVRLLIKRAVVCAELILQNDDFKSYVSENKISVKHAATIIKVIDENALRTVKDAIDIAVQTVREEREEHRLIMLEKRREKRRKQKEERTN